MFVNDFFETVIGLFSDKAPTVSATVATLAVVISLCAFFISRSAFRFSKKAASSDFKAVQTVKTDTAQLIAVLQSLILKGAVYSQQDTVKRNQTDYEKFVDNSVERKAVENFLHSTTALAYHRLVIEKSKFAKEKEEEWRLFFLLLTELCTTKNPWEAGISATKIRIMFEKLKDKDIADIANNLDDLPKAIGFVNQSNKENPIVQAMIQIVNEKQESPINKDNFMDFLRFLREEKKINDPDLDLFWSLLTNDQELGKFAIEQGANLALTDNALINRYKSYISEFMEMPHKTS